MKASLKKHTCLYKYKALYLFQYCPLFPKGFRATRSDWLPSCCFWQSETVQATRRGRELSPNVNLVCCMSGTRSGVVTTAGTSATATRDSILPWREISALKRGCDFKQITGAAWGSISSLPRGEQGPASPRLVTCAAVRIRAGLGAGCWGRERPPLAHHSAFPHFISSGRHAGMKQQRQ